MTLAVRRLELFRNPTRKFLGCAIFSYPKRESVSERNQL